MEVDGNKKIDDKSIILSPSIIYKLMEKEDEEEEAYTEINRNVMKEIIDTVRTTKMEISEEAYTLLHTVAEHYLAELISNSIKSVIFASADKVNYSAVQFAKQFTRKW